MRLVVTILDDAVSSVSAIRSKVLNSYSAESPSAIYGSIDYLESNLVKTCRSANRTIGPHILTIP